MLTGETAVTNSGLQPAKRWQRGANAQWGEVGAGRAGQRSREMGEGEPERAERMNIYRDATLHRAEITLLSCILSMRLLWQSSYSWIKRKIEEMWGGWLNSGQQEGSQRWKREVRAGSFKQKGIPIEKRTEAFAVDRVSSIRIESICLFWDNVDALHNSVSSGDLRESWTLHDTNFPVDLRRLLRVHTSVETWIRVCTCTLAYICMYMCFQKTKCFHQKLRAFSCLFYNICMVFLSLLILYFPLLSCLFR